MTVTVDGKELTPDQLTTLRSALNSFAVDVNIMESADKRFKAPLSELLALLGKK